MRPDDHDPATGPRDLRMPLVGCVAWCAALGAHLLRAPAVGLLAVLVGVLVLVLVGALGLGVASWDGARRHAGTAAGLLLVAVAVVVSTLLRHQALSDNPVADLARERAAVVVTGTVVSDPRPVAGGYGEQVLLRLEVREVQGRGATYRLATPVLVIGDEAWSDVALGSRVRTAGLLAPADGGDLAAVLGSAREPVVLVAPDLWWRGAAAVRSSIRDAVAHRPDDQRALVPALVDGDDAGLDQALAEDFRTTGLTHLTAVSGTNLTLVVGFLLVLARWCRVRGRWLHAVGALGIVGFILLARTEPSVLRAAAMGTVGLLAMGTNGRQRAFRALGVAVVVLLLVQPGLAVSVGFALSALATAGIIVLAPGWRDAMARWLPRWLAELVAVPAAAQLACTPVVAAISGQVSLVAVAANLLVAPVVGPATVLGLTGGLVGLVSPAAGAVAGTGAAWCVGWIVAVARRGAALPGAALDWESDLGSVALLSLLCLVLALAAPWLLRRPVAAVGLAVVMVVAMTVRLPSPGWPPPGWVMAMCDVGQGDALVLRAGPRTGVVVDVGPDPSALDRCLDDLDIEVVPLVVLTHFHADHVDGLSGLFDGRRVGAVETTRMLDPTSGVETVLRDSGEVGLAPLVTAYAETRTAGELTVQTLWPLPDSPREATGDGSHANDASVVLLASVRGVRILLTGDLEPPGQAALARLLPGLDVDVLKVPHHGSRHQDLDFLASLRAEVALVSVGADNDYGHPAPVVLEALEGAGARVLRTDTSGTLAVVVEDGAPVAVSR